MSSVQCDNKVPALRLFGAHFKSFWYIAGLQSLPETGQWVKDPVYVSTFNFLENFVSALPFKILCNSCDLMAMLHFLSLLSSDCVSVHQQMIYQDHSICISVFTCPYNFAIETTDTTTALKWDSLFFLALRC
jgi:hypothetical protein